MRANCIVALTKSSNRASAGAAHAERDSLVYTLLAERHADAVLKDVLLIHIVAASAGRVPVGGVGEGRRSGQHNAQCKQRGDHLHKAHNQFQTFAVQQLQTLDKQESTAISNLS